MYKPDQLDIDEARDEMEHCLTEAAFAERKGNLPSADKWLRLALQAEQSYRRVKREYLDQLYYDETM